MPKRTIHDLTRDVPNGDELLAFINMTQEGNHSDAVISMVGAAILDASLRTIIARKLPNYEPERRGDRIFGDRGPLASLGPKIEMAYGMGLVTNLERDDLHSLRRVRNAFAHAPRQISFDTPEVADELNKLHLWCEPGVDPKPEVIPEQVFAIATMLMVVGLELRQVNWTAVAEYIRPISDLFKTVTRWAETKSAKNA